MALVGQPRQSARAGKHAEQWNLGQADSAAPVIDQKNFVAGERELVAAAGAGAVDGREKLEPAVPRGIFEAVARLVGELAEIDFPGMAGDAEHEDVGAGAEHSLSRAGDDDRAHFRMLEADAIDGVVELDIDAEVVTVEFELVAWTQAGILVEIGQ